MNGQEERNPNEMSGVEIKQANVENTNLDKTKKYNKLSIIAGVLLLISFIFIKLNILEYLTIILFLLSFIFGIISLRQIKKTKEKGEWISVISIIPFILFILGVILFYISIIFMVITKNW